MPDYVRVTLDDFVKKAQNPRKIICASGKINALVDKLRPAEL